MTKQKLKFKIEGGLQKLADFYSATDKDTHAHDTYWHNPGALLEALAVAPAKEIRISTGYKKLAETAPTIDFDKWTGTFDSGMTDGVTAAPPGTAYASLMQAVDPAQHCGKISEDFDNAITVTSVAVVVVVVTVTVVSGRADYNKETPARLPVPNSPKFMAPNFAAEMSRTAQAVAEQIGWFS
jgi:hypothetical protein